MKEQIELIRKDLDSLYEYRQDNWNYTGCHNDIIRHLNSIEKMSQNILKYKTMWEELKKISQNDDCGEKTAHDFLWFLEQTMQELEKKHEIEVNRDVKD